MASLTKPGAICAFLSAVRRFCAALALLLVVALAVGSAAPAFAEDKEVDLRLSLWVPPAHPLTSAAKAWGEDIAKASGGTIKITVFPSEQLGKAFDHYDMARDDIADITYVNPGYQPGRFPIIAIGQMPFMFGDARKGTAALDSWYRKYAATEMKDTHFCFAFIHDPGALHSTRKRIVLPEDLRGVKVRPAQSTIAELVTRLGGTNVQASAPEAREVLERGVADAITFPWGSLYLFGIDKVVKHHMDAPLYTTVFTFSMNKDKYEFDEPRAEEGHGRSLLDRLGGEDRRTLGRLRSRRPRQDESRSRSSRASTSSRPIRWRRGAPRSSRSKASWAAAVKQAGADPDAALARTQSQHREIRRRSMTAAERRGAGMTAMQWTGSSTASSSPPRRSSASSPSTFSFPSCSAICSTRRFPIPTISAACCSAS